eukprot:1980283-Alexandrium_andersonii.AAC.1
MHLPTRPGSSLFPVHEEAHVDHASGTPRQGSPDVRAEAPEEASPINRAPSPGSAPGQCLNDNRR